MHGIDDKSAGVFHPAELNHRSCTPATSVDLLNLKCTSSYLVVRSARAVRPPALAQRQRGTSGARGEATAAHMHMPMLHTLNTWAARIAAVHAALAPPLAFPIAFPARCR